MEPLLTSLPPSLHFAFRAFERERTVPRAAFRLLLRFALPLALDDDGSVFNDALLVAASGCAPAAFGGFFRRRGFGRRGTVAKIFHFVDSDEPMLRCVRFLQVSQRNVLFPDFNASSPEEILFRSHDEPNLHHAVRGIPPQYGSIKYLS